MSAEANGEQGQDNEPVAVDGGEQKSGEAQPLAQGAQDAASEPQAPPVAAPPLPAIIMAPKGEAADLPPPASVPLPAPFVPPRVVPAAKVAEIEPDHGAVLAETKVIIRGERLFRESIVRIDGVLARTVGASEPREIRVLAPPRMTAGPVDLTIQNPGSEPVTVERAFRYDPLPAPKITSVAPARGAVKGGTEVSIIGQGFVKGAVVLFDGAEAAKTTWVDSTTIDARTPPGRSGQAIDVGIRNPDGQVVQTRRAFLYDERYG